MHTWAPAVSDNMIIRKKNPSNIRLCVQVVTTHIVQTTLSAIGCWRDCITHCAPPNAYWCSMCPRSCMIRQPFMLNFVRKDSWFCMMFSIIERRSDTCSRCQRMIKKISMFIAYGDVWIDVVCYRGCLSSGSWKLHFDLIVKHLSSCSSLSNDIKRRAQTELLWN